MQSQATISDYAQKAGSEPIPGYRLIEPLGKGGFGEVWKCEAPGGLYKAIKFVAGAQNNLFDSEKTGADQEFNALQHVKSIRHPFLLQMDRVETVGNQLLIVMELADRSLYDLLEEYKESGEAAVPRVDLLLYLREAAEALDLMNLEHGLVHLDIKPKNLFLVSDHVKVADFGLVNSLAELNGKAGSTFQLAAFTPVYTAPECFLGKVTIFSDQYSLGVVYYELATGQPVFDGQNFRQLAMQHVQQEPDLSLLPEEDRAFVGRALAKDARERFPSCTDFIRSLISGQMQELSIAANETSPVPEEKSVTIEELDITPAKMVKVEESVRRATAREDLYLVEKARTAQAVHRTGMHRAVGKEALEKSRQLSPKDSSVDLGKGDTTGEDGGSSSPEFYVPEQAPAADPIQAGPSHRQTKWPTNLTQYKYLDCLGQSQLGEVWRARVPDGRECILKLVHAPGAGGAFGEEDPCNRLQAIQHPALMPVTLVPRSGQGIAVISEANTSTWSRLLLERPSGVPRDQLLTYLMDLAEVLDVLKKRYHLQHLALNPRSNLLLDDDGQIQIADFGLVELFWLPAGCPLSHVSGRYGAPELMMGRPSHYCDQYSLALIYHELLTGMHPYGAITSRVLSQKSKSEKVDLSSLPAMDRPVIARALSPNPDLRYSNCRELVEALIKTAIEQQKPKGPAKKDSSEVAIADEPETLDSVLEDLDRAAISNAILALVRSAAGDVRPREHHNFTYFTIDRKYVEHQCYARLLPSTVPLKLRSFQEQFGADLVSRGDNRYAFRIRLQTSFWQRCMGKAPLLEVSIQLVPPSGAAATMTDVRVLIRAHNCTDDQGAVALEDQSPLLLEGLREALQVGPEQRDYIRFPLNVPLQVRPVRSDGRLLDPIVCQAKDVSRSGTCIYLPDKLAVNRMVLQLQQTARDPVVSVPTHVTRQQLCDDGRYEIGLKFIKSRRKA